MVILVVRMESTRTNMSHMLKQLVTSNALKFIWLTPLPRPDMKRPIDPKIETSNLVNDDEIHSEEKFAPPAEVSKELTNEDYWKKLASVADRVFLLSHVSILTLVSLFYDRQMRT